MLPDTDNRLRSRIDTDSEWRSLIADIDLLPQESFSGVKAALRMVLRSGLRRRAS
jgi:hypothetical protein